MKDIRYAVEIYPPDSVEKRWADFESSTPFHAMRPGDLLAPADWRKLDTPVTKARVTEVEHSIWEEDSHVWVLMRLHTEVAVGPTEIRLVKQLDVGLFDGRLPWTLVL